MRLATVKIRNKRNGKTRIINEHEWAHDLGKGKYDGWERVGAETRGEERAPVVVNVVEPKPAEPEPERAEETTVEAPTNGEVLDGLPRSAVAEPPRSTRGNKRGRRA